MPRPKNRKAFTLGGKGINLNDPPPPPMLEYPPIEGPQYPYYDYDRREWVWNPNATYDEPRGNAWADWRKDES